jgi:hypothetical protein
VSGEGESEKKERGRGREWQVLVVSTHNVKYDTQILEDPPSYITRIREYVYSRVFPRVYL